MQTPESEHEALATHASSELEFAGERELPMLPQKDQGNGLVPTPAFLF